MKKDTFSNRLNEAMLEKGIKQSQLSKKTKIDKTLISKYQAGIADAGNDRLPKLADALNVNEVWLMGYDVPKEKDWVSQNVPSKTNTTETDNFKNFLRKKGFLKENEDITDDQIDNLIDFAKRNKDFIMKK